MLLCHLQFSSVQSLSRVRLFATPWVTQHARPPCPSPTPGVYSNSCPLSRWCHPTISSSVAPFSSCPQSLPASGSFPVSQLFAWGGQSIGVSASTSALPMNTQDWSPLGWTGWISLQSKGLCHLTLPNLLFLFLCRARLFVMNVLEFLGFPGGSDGKEYAWRALQETWVWSLSWKVPLEKGIATHSSIFT